MTSASTTGRAGNASRAAAQPTRGLDLAATAFVRETLRVKWLLRGRKIADVVDAPPLTDPEQLVAIDRLTELQCIEQTEAGLCIGSGVNHHTIEHHQGITSHWSALADGSALVGSPSTRNVGTLGGNVMNASPAMDTGAPLIVFGAEAELRHIERRIVRIAQDEERVLIGAKPAGGKAGLRRSAGAFPRTTRPKLTMIRRHHGFVLSFHARKFARRPSTTSLSAAC